MLWGGVLVSVVFLLLGEFVFGVFGCVCVGCVGVMLVRLCVSVSFFYGWRVYVFV